MPDFCVEEAGYGMDTRCTKGNQNLPYVYNVWLDHGRQRSPKITLYVSTQDSSVVKVISAYFRILHCRHVKHKVSYRNTQYHVSGISNTSLTRVSLLTKHTLNTNINSQIRRLEPLTAIIIHLAKGSSGLMNMTYMTNAPRQ